jgi:hypothetical protein
MQTVQAGSDRPAPQPSPTSGLKNQRRRILIVTVIAVVLIIAGGYVWFYETTYPRLGPGSFFVYNATKVSPGSIGCIPKPGELCYSLTMGNEFNNLHLSDVRFSLTDSNVSNPNGPPVHVGSNAGVSVLQSTSAVAGQWNWTSGTWSLGASWTVPVNPGVTLVFDSGLLGSSTLNNTIFWATLSAPGVGSAGAQLH